MIKLASDKSFNRSVCPVMNIKGKTVEYPLKLKYNNFHFQSGRGVLGPKQMMIMDIIGTKLIHLIYGNQDFSCRIPTNNERLVKEKSCLYMPKRLLKFLTTNLSRDGLIPKAYSQEDRLSHIDKMHGKIKNPVSITLNDGQLKYDAFSGYQS